MHRFKGLFILISLFYSSFSLAHHYKGLPHFSYFENYPQIPYLEFIKEAHDFEIYMTVYNFQGLNLDQVSSPDDVRLYIYIFDINNQKVYKQPASFSVYSNESLVYETGMIPPEQENIFVIQKKIKQQDNLKLLVEFNNESNELVSIEMPFQITKTFFQKYGVYLAIALFFLIVVILKMIMNYLQSKSQGALIEKRT